MSDEVSAPDAGFDPFAGVPIASDEEDIHVAPTEVLRPDSQTTEVLENPFGAEIHVAIAPHGVLIPELMPGQISTPIGNPSFWWVARFLPIGDAIGAANVSLRAIPEPSTALLGGLAAMGLLVSRRRRS